MPCVKVYLRHFDFTDQWSALCFVFSPKFCSFSRVGTCKRLRCRAIFCVGLYVEELGKLSLCVCCVLPAGSKEDLFRF